MSGRGFLLARIVDFFAGVLFDVLELGNATRWAKGGSVRE